MEKFIETVGCFRLIMDSYNGITIQKGSIPKDKEFFEQNLRALLAHLKAHQRNLLWIEIDLDKSYLIPFLTMHGFVFHTCETEHILLVKQLVENAIVPTASNHTLGVGVVVINEANELLVIKERVSKGTYKLPGGHIDDGELISSAVVREVFEETGIEVVFESIISVGHFFPHQFNKSNLYILCVAKPTSYEINITDTNEIEDAKWVNVFEYLEDENVIEYNQVIVKSALETKGLRQFDLESFKHIPKSYELFSLEKSRN